jgi:uroporphyrinogen-III synthase
MPVLVTRPEIQSRIFARALSGRFGDAVRPLVAPLMAPRFLKPAIPAGDYAAVIFTSAIGVEGATRLGVPLPRRAFCVGRKTAVVAEAAGFLVWSADGDSDALVSLIVADRPFEKLLYIRGVNTRGNVAGKLKSAGIGTESLVVYRQVPQPMSAEGTALLREPGDVVLPIFSPRSARLFAKAMPQEMRATLHIAAMSAAVAEAALKLPHTAMVVAERPDADGMLDAVQKLLVDVSPP